MTREEAKQIFLNREFIEVDGGSIFDGDKWREACRVISKWLEQEPIIDKARAEIEKSMKWAYATGDDEYAEGFEKSLEIIDKYKEESGA